jgi:hypothetical protein
VLSLKTEGFAELVADVADKARQSSGAAKAVRIALTLDDRFAEEAGLTALAGADRVVVDFLRGTGLGLAGELADRLFLTRTGRLAVRLDGAPAPADAHLLTGLDWAGEEAADVKARWSAENRELRRELEALHAELAEEPVESVHARIDRIEYAVVHMAPLLIYVGERAYSNLGKFSNLPGKSLKVGHARSVLMGLRAQPVREWTPEDACLVACLDVLMSSGAPVRAEEFNGAQLTPRRLASFLVDLLAEYDAPADAGARSDLRSLTAFAAACSDRRRQMIADGRLPYRVINGLSLHKRERWMAAPATLGAVPELVRAHVSELLGISVSADMRIADLAPWWAELAGRLAQAPAPESFGSAFEATLHGLLTAIAEAFEADVAMSRGAQRFDPLRADARDDADPLALATGDFYCCVTPTKSFVERFGEDRAGLTRTLSAYSARMRFNTWHYLPHTLGIVEREPGRDDWFFAPTMPDVTEWSDQHHTGHVAFGVRYAIRIPFGISYDGRQLTGLYDLRLMRAGRQAYTIDDLRRAIAATTLLRQLYQAMSAHEPVIGDFGKDWYERFHG